MLCPYNGKQIRITSKYGPRFIFGQNEFHRGLDIVGVDSKEIVAIAPGRVVRSRIVTDKNNATWTWGNYVAIQQDDGNVCYYCHMSERKVSVGQRVEKGTVLGIEGTTGLSTGNHLHIEIRNSAGTAFNVADYIGISNEIGSYTVPKEQIDYASEVCKIVGLTDGTKAFLNTYKFASDLWRKIYSKLQK